MKEQVKDALERWQQKEYSSLIGDVDAATLADAFSVEHPADEDETLDHVWFRSVSPDGNSWIHGEYASIYLRSDNRVELCIGDESAIQEHIKTRGDVRRLCRALGIELKGMP